MASGFVYFVGAGPGDPGLLTLRGKEVLESADSVVYDSLAHPDILKWAAPGAELVCMGKLGYVHPRPQTEVTAAILDRARQGKTVVRLKGGDPSVFGRIGEELRALAQEEIPFEIVPGVTAALGAAAYAGIPLTHRDLAPSVTLVTGHRRADGGAGPDIDWDALGRVSGSLVVYMGVRRLEEVSRELIAAGRTSETPVVLVRRATWPDQRILSGTLESIAEQAAAEDFRPPAVAFIGEIADSDNFFPWFHRKPLRGKKILVTRGASQVSEFSELVAKAGAVAVELPLIELRPHGHKSVKEAALKKLFSFDWVIFSSVNAVEYTFRELDALALDARVFGAARVCAVGPKTKQALIARGIKPDVVPTKFIAESLIEELEKQTNLAGASVLIPRAREAREVIPEELTNKGARVDVLPIYENVRPDSYPKEAVDLLKNAEIDMAALASSSAARNFAAFCRENSIDLSSAPCAAIGPSTRATAEAEGLTVVCEPEIYTLEGMIEAMENYFKKPNPSLRNAEQ